MVTAACLLLLLLVALLAIPLRLVFQISRQQTLHGEVTLQWLFGLVHVSLPIAPQHAPPRATEKSPAPAARRRTKPPPSRLDFLRLMRQQPFRDRLSAFVRAIWRALKKREIYLHLRIGLDDPAQSGWLWAAIGPLSAMLYTVQDADIEIVPDFLEAGLELESRGNIQLIPLQILYLLLGVALSPSIWRAIRQARRANAPVRPTPNPS